MSPYAGGQQDASCMLARHVKTPYVVCRTSPITVVGSLEALVLYYSVRDSYVARSSVSTS